MLSSILPFLYLIPCVLIATVFHELAHGLISYWLGDPTPKDTGRLSLNPLRHIDPFGLLCLLIFRVGWAKPVIINPEYYKNRRLGTFLVAFAGPLTNYIIAFLTFIFLGIVYKLASIGTLNFMPIEVLQIIVTFLQYLAIINIGLGTFNLIPIPPLDGSRILGSFLSANAYQGYMRFERYGFLFIMLILFLDRTVATLLGQQSLMTLAIEGIFNGLFRLMEIIFQL